MAEISRTINSNILNNLFRLSPYPYRDYLNNSFRLSEQHKETISIKIPPQQAVGE